MKGRWTSASAGDGEQSNVKLTKAAYSTTPTTCYLKGQRNPSKEQEQYAICCRCRTRDEVSDVRKCSANAGSTELRQ